MRILKRKQILILFALCCFFGPSASANKPHLTLIQRQKNVAAIFDEISKSSEFTVHYDKILEKSKKKYDIAYHNETVFTVLQDLQKLVGFEFEVQGSDIIVHAVANGGQQQTKRIKGSVVDENGQPLPGATVLEKGTSNGTTTDFDGNFAFELTSESPVLVVSYIGYLSKDVPVGNNTDLTVGLQPDVANLDEVVVVGYGSTKKKDLTGSVATIKTEDIQRGVPTDVLSGIQGQIAGLQISSDSGDPAAGVNISIRGMNSISAGTNPLFVIDGMPYDINTGEIATSGKGINNSSNPLNLINPADIKSITVLKDASATSIYGSRGANGVILIETKSPAQENTVYSFNISSGLATVTNELDVLNANEFIEFRRVVQPNGALFYAENDEGVVQIQDPYSAIQHDWQDELLRTGLQRNYNFSINGRSKKSNYSVSLGLLDNEALVRNNESQRYSALVKLDTKKNDHLRFGFNLQGTLSELSGATQSGGGDLSFNGIVQGLAVSIPLEWFNEEFDPGDVYISPTNMIDDTYKNSSTQLINPGAYIEYDFNDSFSLVGRAFARFTNSKGKEFYGKETSYGVGSNGYAGLSHSKSTTLNASLQLNYDKNFNDKHTIKGLLAGEVNTNDFESFNLVQTDFLTETTGVDDIGKGANTQLVNSVRDKSKRISAFSRLNYNYSDIHLLTMNFRVDGSDKFGSGSRFGYFPSAAYSWNFSNEKFLLNSNFINNGKLRISYGVSGNDRIPSFRYLPELDNAYYDGVLGSAPSSQANDQLKWETTYQFDIGLDLSFFNNRVSITADYYDKQTKDMLLQVPTPGQTGYAQQWRNIGELSNKGIELELNTLNVTSNKFQWRTSINVSGNRNEVLDLGGSEFLPINVPGGWISDIGRVGVGQQIGRAYGYVFDGVYQIDDFTWQDNSNPSIDHLARNYELKEEIVSVNGTNVRPGSFKFKDLNGDGIIDLDNDRDYISNSSPDFFGGITNKFTWGNLDLTVFLQGSYGNEVFNESRWRLEGGSILSYMNATRDFFYNMWTPDNPTNNYGTYAGANATSMITSSYYVEDASYLRLKNITFGYTFGPDILSRLGLQSARLYVTGNNLYTWTNYSGYDPEVNSGNLLMSGVDFISYPRMKNYIIGLDVSF
nr:TonB-dependent receptor [uncultured Allomuricauda sp.]